MVHSKRFMPCKSRLFCFSISVPFWYFSVPVRAGTGNFFVFLFFTTMHFFQCVVPRIQCGVTFIFVNFLFSFCSLSAASLLRTLAVYGQECFWRWPIHVVLVGPIAFLSTTEAHSFFYVFLSESVSLAAPSCMASSSWFGQFPNTVSKLRPPLPRGNRFVGSVHLLKIQSKSEAKKCLTII
jgi:hypothetical protein